MSYLGDIRENSIGLNGEIWESDNRIETRHYWNGAYIDLCDLPAEDYAKTIFVTNGGGSNDGPVTPTVKAITLEIIDGDVVITYPGALTSDMYVAISYNNGKNFSKMLATGTIGSSGVNMGLNDVMTIERYGIGVTEADAYNEKKTFQDDEYKYQINYEKPMTMPVAYQLSLMKGEIDMLSDEELIAHMEKVDGLGMKNEFETEPFVAVIQPQPVEGLAEMSASEMTAALIAASQDIVIVTDKKIIDILAVSTNDSVIDGWNNRVNDLMVDGVAYHVWYKRAKNTELSAVYDPAVPEAVIDVPQESITFIIKYA